MPNYGVFLPNKSYKETKRLQYCAMNPSHTLYTKSVLPHQFVFFQTIFMKIFFRGEKNSDISFPQCFYQTLSCLQKLTSFFLKHTPNSLPIVSALTLSTATGTFKCLLKQQTALHKELFENILIFEMKTQKYGETISGVKAPCKSICLSVKSEWPMNWGRIRRWGIKQRARGILGQSQEWRFTWTQRMVAARNRTR